MTVMIAELYDALRDAGASEEKARAAAKAVSDNEQRMDKLDTRMDKLEARMAGLDARMTGMQGQIDGLKAQIDGLKAQIEALKIRMDTLTWVVGLNAALTVAVLVRLFVS